MVECIYCPSSMSDTVPCGDVVYKTRNFTSRHRVYICRRCGEKVTEEVSRKRVWPENPDHTWGWVGAYSDSDSYG